MKKITTFGALAMSCFLYGMEVSKMIVPNNDEFVMRKEYFRPIKAEIENRHDVKRWHSDLTDAVVFNKPYDVSLLLIGAGKDATDLVCSASSAYGPIIRATYIENKPEIRNLLKKYMDKEYFKQCFNLEKSRLYAMPLSNRISPAAEQLVRDFYSQDPIEYPLSVEERAKLNIK